MFASPLFRYDKSMRGFFLFLLLLFIPSSAMVQSFEDSLQRVGRRRAAQLTQDYLYRGKNPFGAQDQCGTPLMKVLRKERAKENFRKAKCFSSQFLDDPSCFSLDQKLSTQHFDLWYTLSGTNAVDPTDVSPANGIPDYIDRAATYAEQSYDFLVNQLGYLKPPTTALHPRTPMYFINTGAFGYTDFAFFEGDTQGPVALNAIHHTMQGLRSNDDPEGSILGALKVTIVHEFFHAVKASYDWSVDLNFGFWWDESTSTWSEDELYPQVNDYLWYLCYSFSECSAWLAQTTIPLNSPVPGLHRYGGALLAKFFTESHTHPEFQKFTFGRNIIRETWECEAQIQGGNSLECIDTVLRRHGTTLSEAYARFMQAVFLKDFQDGTHPKFENVKSNNVVKLSHMSTLFVTPQAPLPNFQVVSDPLAAVANPLEVGAVNLQDTAERFTFSGAPACANAVASPSFFKVISISNASIDADQIGYELLQGNVNPSLAPPATLIGSPQADTGFIHLTWPTVQGAVTYGVYRGTNQNPFGLLKDRISGTSFLDQNLASGVTYFYEVRSEDAGGQVSCPSPLASSIAFTKDAVVKNRPFAMPNPATPVSNVTIQLDVGSAFGKFSGSEVVNIGLYSGNGGKLLQRATACTILNGMLSCSLGKMQLPSGVYFYSMEMNTDLGRVRKVGKLVFLR